MQYFINHSQAERWTAERVAYLCVDGDFHNEKYAMELCCTAWNKTDWL